MESTPAVDMTQEIFRMASFGQNPLKPVTSFGDIPSFTSFPSGFVLSKAGFYRDSASVEDEVRCFSCGLVLKDWGAYYAEFPLSIHLCKSPNCEFLKCQSDENTTSRGSESPSSFDSLLTVAELSTVRRQLFPGDENVNGNNNRVLTNGQIQSRINLPFKPKVGDNSMLFESKRYSSFDGLSEAKAKDLASNGFVLKSVNKIVCVFCGKQTDCPGVDTCISANEIHKPLNPNCPFIRGFQLGNVTCALESAIKRDNQDNDDNVSEENNSVNDSVISQPAPTFYNPYFEDFTVRRNTFSDWPLQMKPSAQQLTEAGFFYSGTFDKVTCFACGHSLRKWEPEADAKVQHAKHSPGCVYLQSLPEYQDIKQQAAQTWEMTLCEVEFKDEPVSCESPVKSPFPFKPSVDASIITGCQAALASQFEIEVDLQSIREAICHFKAVFNSFPNLDLLIGWMLTTRKEFTMMQEMRGNIHVKDQQIVHKDQQIVHKDQQIVHKDQQIIHKDQQIEQDRRQIEQRDQQIEQDRRQIEQRDQQIEQRDQQIEQRDQQIEQRDQQIDHHRLQIQAKERDYINTTHQVSEKEQRNDELSAENVQLKQQLKSKDDVLNAKTERISQLEEDNIRMHNMIMQLRRELQVSTSRRG